jgi:gliding motility-associated-like protein
VQILQLVLIDFGVKANKLAHRAVLTLAILVLLSVFLQAQAQNVCINPAYPGSFSIDKAKVCVGTSITVSTTANAPVYNFQYDGKSAFGQFPTVNSKTFSYTSPGSYTIVQVGGGLTGTIACREVVVLPVDPVKFTARGCSGRRAIVTVDASTLGQYDSYEIYWGDGVREQKTRADVAVDLSHTYTNAGSYAITVQGIYNAPASCRSTLTSAPPITVTSAATQPIITSLKTTSDNSIDITYQAGTGLSVQLYQKVNGTYTATSQKGSGSGTFSAQTDARQVQCFQVVAQDACSTTGLSSDEVCSLVINVAAANKQNNLSWQPYAGSASQFRFYRLYRNGGVNGQVTNRTTGTYADANNITCGTQYCYSLEATAGPTIIMSQPVCVTGINSSAPDSLNNVVVSIENNRPRLVAALPTTGAPTAYTLVISRSNGPSGPFLPVGTVANKNTFVDDSANPLASSYCYQVAYQSNCGLTSVPSKPVCTVLLSSKSNKGIDWTVDSPFTPERVDNYILEVVDSLNGTKREIPISGNTHYEPDPNDPNLQSQRYRIIAVSTNGTISYSNFFTFRREAKILVPDAFSPNGDGLNDMFLAKGIYFDQYRMSVYDRWGEVVYTTIDKTQGWDGRIKGQLAEQGQYMYRIEVIDLTGFQTVRTGAVLLVR